MQRPLQCQKSAAAARCTFVAIRQPGLPITMIIILTITFSIATNIIIITVIMGHRGVYLGGAVPSRPHCRDQRDLLSSSA